MNIDIDGELGEALQKDEEQLSHEIADHIAAKLRKKPVPARRDAHPKAHGCVKAEFQVENNLATNLAQGVFAPGTRYKAWIRFSNGNEDPTRPDAKRDARGMAIKLLEVPGEKILLKERNELTQDFIMINYPAFFIDDPAHYLALLRAKDTLESLQEAHLRLDEEKRDSFLHPLHQKGLSGLGTLLDQGARDLVTILKGIPALSPAGLINFLKMSSSEIASPFETAYWSMVPYRLGDPPQKQKIKFRAKPHLPKEAAVTPDNPSPNFLRETMIRQLEPGAGLRQFDFEIQVGAPAMEVENSIKVWEMDEAPFTKVATITIPEQVFATGSRDDFGERLSFTPWHALPQHRPLGAVNRIRRVVYDTISDLRSELNFKAPRRPEPRASDPEMRT
jgi:hypothetical protein